MDASPQRGEERLKSEQNEYRLHSNLSRGIFRIGLSTTITEFHTKAIHRVQMLSKMGHRLFIQALWSFWIECSSVLQQDPRG